MQIGEAARRAGLTVKTVRYYANIGMVTPRQDAATGYRDYGEGDVAKLQFVGKARKFDFSVEECRELLGLYEDRNRPSREVKALTLKKVGEIDARLAELAHALKESAESEGRAQAAAAQASAAKSGAEQALEKCVDDLRAAEDRVRALTQRSDGAQERDQSGQAKALMLQAECSELRAKVEKRNREVRELNQMLKAWEAMRHSKDQQIAQLVERCRKFEEEAADKARAIDAMRSRLGRGGAAEENGSVGSVSFNRTPNSARRSPTGTSMRLSPSPAPSSVSSFAFGTRAPSSSRSPENVKAEVAGGEFGKENPNPAAYGAYGSATKRFASTLGVKGSIDDEVRTRVGGAYVSVVGDVSPRGGVPSPKRALRTLGR